jgi:hypothetical protein
MRKTVREAASLYLWLAGVLAMPRLASGDAVSRDEYRIWIHDNTVGVCVYGETTRRCPGGGDLLREEPSTGAVVRLPDVCTSGSCYVDECVPPGDYRYGYAEPLACESASGTDYFGTAEVTTPLDTCERRPDNPGPADYAGTVPWNDDPIRCEPSYGRDGCSCSSSPSGFQWEEVGVVLIQVLAVVVGVILWKRGAASR